MPSSVAPGSSDRPPQPTGGRIDVTGARIALAGAELDASGAGGGGQIRIGGDYQGRGSLQRADTLTRPAGGQAARQRCIVAALHQIDSKLHSCPEDGVAFSLGCRIIYL